MRERRTESVGAGFGTELQDPFGAVAGGALEAEKLGSARVDGLKCEIRDS